QLSARRHPGGAPSALRSSPGSSPHCRRLPRHLVELRGYLWVAYCPSVIRVSPPGFLTNKGALPRDSCNMQPQNVNAPADRGQGVGARYVRVWLAFGFRLFRFPILAVASCYERNVGFRHRGRTVRRTRVAIATLLEGLAP